MAEVTRGGAGGAGSKPGLKARAVERMARAVAGERLDALQRRLEDLETEVQECRQLNIRLDRDMERLVPRLLEAVRRELGLKVSQSDLFRLGMKELAKKYLPDDTPKRK